MFPSDTQKVSRKTSIPELLAPAGNWECAFAAIANGANAIYFGLPRFNARLRANNFTEGDLPSLMRFLHEHGARGFVTMNTLVFTSELQDAINYLQILEHSGVDGVIVQDIGLASLVKKVAPRLELHASTQMTISSPEGLAFIRRILPLDRAVLAREMSLKELKKMEPENFPLEVFVHGALCVAYSGQCLTSESLGQRSANRGECAQACRMPYELICDGKKVPLGERRYLLSPQDLAAIDCIPELVEMGIESYKIEGRLKSPEYVAAVVAAYRKALDAAQKHIPVQKAVGKRDRYAMQMVFSRGFSTGWLHGADHPRLTHGRHGKKRGACAGIVERIGKGWVDVDLQDNIPLSPGDGFVFDLGEDRNKEAGGRIWKVDANRLFFHGKASNIDWNRLRPGIKIWKTDDPALNSALRQSWKGMDIPHSSVTLNLTASGTEGTPLTVSAPDFGIQVSTSQPLVKAEKHPLTDEILRNQLGRLGDTGFTLGTLISELPPGLMMPVSLLNQLRRSLIEQITPLTPPVTPSASTTRLSLGDYLPPVPHNDISTPSRLSILCRTMEQLAAALDSGVDLLYLDFEDIRHYKEGVQLARSHPAAQIYLATPRIQKPGEKGFFQVIERAIPDGVLIRNPGALDYFRDKDIHKVGDFTLNISNPLTAALLQQEGKLERMTISYDLNINQILDLLRSSTPSLFELTLHQHMPMFHMEHCVFCTFLSKGNNHLNCGRPCEQHTVYLRDRVGQSHRLIADAGCRNTLYNGKAQTAATYYPLLYKAGLRSYRIDLLEENTTDTAKLIRGYSSLLSGEHPSHAWLTSLNAMERIGVTEGTLHS